MPNRVMSIRTRLLFLALGAVLGVAVVTGWLGYRHAIHEVDELIDAELAQYARIMLALGHEDDDDEVTLPAMPGHGYETKILFQIWEQRSGQAAVLLQRSPEAPQGWPAGVGMSGFSEATIGAHTYRLIAMRARHKEDDHGDRLVLAGFELAIRDELARDIALGNLQPYVFALPILIVLLILAVRHGLAPLQRMEQELASRRPGHLEALATTHTPGELRPLVEGMNHLLQRMRQALDNERRFTGDAAHELRTPLAALRMQLQVAQRTPDAAEREAAIGKALRGADRMTHLVTQLLALSRLESGGEDIPMGEVDLAALSREALDDIAALAVARNLHVDARIGKVSAIRGNTDLLRALLRNLLDNAARYCPDGAHIRLDLDGADSGVHLCVRDNGPGIDAALRHTLGERFRRMAGQHTEGAGLGLSIVRRIAERHGATIQFSDGLDAQGLGVHIQFPPPPQAPEAAHS